MKHNCRLLIACLAALSIAPVCLTGCDEKQKSKTHIESQKSSVTPEDEARSELARLVKAIEDGDAATVADNVLYPLKRPAPIPPIKTKEEFIAYFPTLFDDGYRDLIRQGSFSEDWTQMGFRGVMYGRGSIWVDGSIASGGCIKEVLSNSEAEHKLYERLLEEEKKTLHESLLDKKFAPVMYFETDDGKTVGRIDSFNMIDHRIALYNKPVHPGDRPADTFLAVKVVEGRNGSHTYLDTYWHYFISINKDGPMGAPQLEINYRENWWEEFGTPRAASYRTWNEILELE